MASACCFFWFVAACIFAGVFGWAYVRERAIETKCVGIQLVPNATNANGKFKNGYECVHRSTLPKVCLDYFKDVPECETERRLNDVDEEDVRLTLNDVDEEDVAVMSIDTTYWKFQENKFLWTFSVEK
jgi:hypothetical protein